MTSKDFVTGLAEIMGVEKTEVATVDRVLAKAGFRGVARGRYRPDITLQEGLQIVLAWAGTHNLTMAAEEVERLKCFHVAVTDESEPVDAPSEEHGEYWHIYGTSRVGLAGQSLFSVLGTAARTIGKGEFPAEKYWVNVQKGGNVELIHSVGFFRNCRVKFDFLGKLDLCGEKKKTPGVVLSVKVSGIVLKWIYDVTEGA